MTLSMEMSDHDFKKKSSELKFEHNRVHFSPYIFFLYYIDINIGHERENCTPLRSYIFPGL